MKISEIKSKSTFSKNNLEEYVRDIFFLIEDFCKDFNNSGDIITLLWDCNKKIEPFCHRIEGREPDYTDGKDLHQKASGIDGLIEIKDKARRIKKSDLLKYIENNYYLDYISYCFNQVFESSKIKKIINALKTITKLLISMAFKEEHSKINEERFFEKFNSKINKKSKLDSLLSESKRLEIDRKFDDILIEYNKIFLNKLKKFKVPYKVREKEKKSKSVFKIDLHLHSHYSDCGGQSVGQIFCSAKKKGLDVISLTDHNTFSGVLKALELGEIFKIKVIPGVELSTGIKVSEKKVIERRDVLVYFPDVEKFKKWAKEGFDSTTLDIFKRANDREHQKYLWGNLPIEEALQWAMNNEGISILAHPGYYNNETPEKLKNLFKKGLDGLEIFNLKYNDFQHYSKNSLNEVMYHFLNILKDMEYIMHKNTKPIATMGSDSHVVHLNGQIDIEKEFIKDFLEYYNLSDPEHMTDDFNEMYSTMTKNIINSLGFS